MFLYFNFDKQNNLAWDKSSVLFIQFFTWRFWNSPVTVDFPSQRPVTRSFDVFFDLRLNKRLSKQSRRRWFETPSRPLWRHCNDIICSQHDLGVFRHFSYRVSWPLKLPLNWRATLCVFLKIQCSSLNTKLDPRFRSYIQCNIKMQDASDRYTRMMPFRRARRFLSYDHVGVNEHTATSSHLICVGRAE